MADSRLFRHFVSVTKGIGGTGTERESLNRSAPEYKTDSSTELWKLTVVPRMKFGVGQIYLAAVVLDALVC